MNSSPKRLQDFDAALGSPIVNLEQLKQLAWNGVPEKYRSMTWKILLKYMPTNRETRQATLKRKRSEYFQMVDTYILNPSLKQDANEEKTSRLINGDVERTLPESSLFRNKRIKTVLSRVLYVWNMRHPACGYVQGINDIVTPFVIVFLGDHVKINLDTLEDVPELANLSQQALNTVQADSYWCLSKLLDGILDNYTPSWPGIQKSYNRLLEIIKRVDSCLLQHFTAQSIDFYHLYLKWVTCLLLRQFTSRIGLRLYDTYLADQNNYFTLCLYVMAAIVLKFSKRFKKMSMEQMLKFQQNMPTKVWTEEDLTIVIAQAFVYEGLFDK